MAARWWWRDSMTGVLIGSTIVAVAAWSGVRLVRRWAERRAVLDYPNDRSSHTRPTPRGGGLAVALLVSACGILGVGNVAAGEAWAWAACVVASATVALVSWIDDLHGLSFALRLAVHVVAATGFVLACRLTLGETLLSGDAGWIWSALAVVWIVGLTNAYNFMDGIDGIAGGQGVVAGVAFLLAGWLGGTDMLAWMGAVAAAACLGFLVHNWPPARIFMGDVGSAFLGFCFAAMAVISAASGSGATLVGVFALWPFVFDSTMTFGRRLLRGENVFAAHRSHLYQRLVIAGWSHAAVSTTYIALAAVGMACGVGLSRGSGGAAVASAATVPLLAAALWVMTNLLERSSGVAGRGPRA